MVMLDIDLDDLAAFSGHKVSLSSVDSVADL